MKANTSVLLEAKKPTAKQEYNVQSPPRYLSPRRLDEMKCALLNKKEAWIINEPK